MTAPMMDAILFPSLLRMDIQMDTVSPTGLTDSTMFTCLQQPIGKGTMHMPRNQETNRSARQSKAQ